MAADPAMLAQFAQLLQQTVSSNSEGMRAAEQQLRAAEINPGFGLILLELLRGGSIADGARQAGAIYFKNYIRRQWSVEGAGGGIAAADRQAIKQHLLTLMLQAPKPVQVQLAAGLEEISLVDYPGDWQSLLPEMVQHLKTSQDMSVLKGTMETAHTVFLKFRSMGRSEAVLKEIKYTVMGFQETHLAVFAAACQRALGGGLDAGQLTVHWELLNATIGAFYSLNVVDLPEFFEDHSKEYFQGFLEILKFQNEALTGKADQPGLLEQVKGGVCECFALYTDKYQEEFMPYLLECVNAVYTLLMGLDQSEKNDQLVAKGIHFLSSAAATQWPNSPFTDPNVLSGICEKVVFPNILLRDADVELFEDNPLEYVRRDMEAADQETRRRSAMDLVKAMGRVSEAKVTEILIGYVKALMEKSQTAQAEQAERFKDACIYLCIAMAVRGETAREGVLVTNQNVNVVDFFTSLVVPQITAEPVSQNSVMRASCLKFITVFRNQLPREQVGAILPAICRHIAAENPVVHTYTAICIEKLISVRDRSGQQSAPRYDPAAMKASLLQMVQPILQIIAENKGIPMNEYLMRTVARIFAFLKQLGGEVGLQTLSPLSAILVAMSANPSNPVFNHNLFEAIASIVKVCVPTQPDAVEAAMLPAFGQVLERNVTDFLPYTFQILGLLLDATPSVKPLYQQLFARLLTVELWRAQANVPGLIRLLRAYFCKHAAFADLLQAHMMSILERLQFVLNNRRTESAAFELLNSMYMHLPLEFYRQHFKTLITVVLTRLQNSKSPKTPRDFVISCSLCVHRHGLDLLPAALNEIQPGLVMTLMQQFWPGVLKMQLKTDERKVCTVALAKLMTLPDVRQNAQLFGVCCVGLMSVLGLTPTSVASLADDASDDEDKPADGGAGLDFEVSFSKLRNTDLPGSASGLAPDIPDLHAATKLVCQQAQLVAPVVQLAQANAEIQQLARFLQ